MRLLLNISAKSSTVACFIMLKIAISRKDVLETCCSGLEGLAEDKICCNEHQQQLSTINSTTKSI